MSFSCFGRYIRKIGRPRIKAAGKELGGDWFGYKLMAFEFKGSGVGGVEGLSGVGKSAIEVEEEAFYSRHAILIVLPILTGLLW
jgi:hypothetical protein